MKFKYLIISSIVWGVNELTKERFGRAAQAGDTILDLEEMKVFDPDTNAWVEIEGDK